MSVLEKTPSERRLQTVLRIYTFIFACAAIAYESLPFLSFTSDFGRLVIFVPNSVVKVSILALICMYAAGNVRERLGLVPVFFAAHVVSISAMIAIILYGDTSGTIRMGSTDVTIRQALTVAIITDVIVNIPLLIFYFMAKAKDRARRVLFVEESEAMHFTYLKAFLYLLVVLYLAGAVFYLWGGLSQDYKNVFIQLPLVSNSVVKVALLAFVGLYMIRNISSNVSVVGILVSSGIISVVSKLVLLLAGKADQSIDSGDIHISTGDILWKSLVVEDGLVVGILVTLTVVAYQRLYRPKFLRPIEYRTLMALADVIVYGRDEKVPFRDIAANADKYIAEIKAHRRWVYRAATFAIQFLPLLQLRPPLSEMDSEDRKKYLEKNFYTKKYSSWVPLSLRNYMRALIRIAQQLCYLGYYNDTRCHKSIGYTPLSQRNVTLPPVAHSNLRVELPDDIDSDVIETDVCIVGSGAAGSILAYELAKRERKVTVLEKGKYVQPADFTENEIEMIGKLYADGVFQQTEDFKFTILQGNCVGGSTVINNAVSFDPPERVVETWNANGAGINVEDLSDSVTSVRNLISIQSQSRNTHLNPSCKEVDQGVAAVDPNGAHFQYSPVDANIDAQKCIGCGYCNIGCRFGIKLSMLDVTLPKAQAEFPGKVRIIAECKAERITTISGVSRKKAYGVQAVIGESRTVLIKAKTIILSAGTIASSYLLKRSGIGKKLPVGRNMCFNMGTPIYAEFNRKVDATEGLQISHFIKPKDDLGFVFETWWNPPVAQAINMPGWFEVHFDNMLKYDRSMAVGILVGTESTGKLINALTGGPGVVYTPSDRDLTKMARAIEFMGEILFKAGAIRVMLNTWSYHEFRDFNTLKNSIDKIVVQMKELTLGTGHPQGGNAISNDPLKGVVNDRFQVHGFENLYVCDASVFPTSLTVNPQLTVMGLAHYAASRIT